MTSRPKRNIVQPVTYAEEFPPAEQKKKRKANRVDKTLYDVEIVERDHKTKRVRIHYVGYDVKFDEWITNNKEDVCPIVKLNKAYVPDEGSLISRKNLLCDTVVTSIKQKLYSHRLNDPDSRVEVECDEDVFSLFSLLCNKKIERGRTFYHPKQLSDLNQLLKINWHQRIFNENGDYAFIIPDTLRISLNRRIPIKEFSYHGGKYIEVATERRSIMVFTFVRGDGNKAQYEEKLRC